MTTTLLREPEAARILGFTLKGLQRKRLAGEVPFVRLGRAIRYDAADLRRYIDSHRHDAQSEVA